MSLWGSGTVIIFLQKQSIENESSELFFFSFAQSVENKAMIQRAKAAK